MGNVRGALFASLLVGELQALLSLAVKPNVATVMVLVILMATLVARREGLQKP